MGKRESRGCKGGRVGGCEGGRVGVGRRESRGL